MNLEQFDIVIANLNPTKLSEQSGIRPCVILQSNAGLDSSSTIIVAILTSKKTNNIYPFEIFIEKDLNNNLSIDSKLKLDQLKVIDKSRITDKIGKISDKSIINNIFSSMDNIFDRQGYFR